MCLIVFAYKALPGCPLLIASNRDEFFERPTKPAHFWDDAPEVLAGRDMKNMGTWLGITKTGKFAALTNFREPRLMKSNPPSRGLLVSDFLTGSTSAIDYLKDVSKKGRDYDLFNLIVGTPEELLYYSNAGENDDGDADGISIITPGVHSISNSLLDVPWPKTTAVADGMDMALKKGLNSNCAGADNDGSNAGNKDISEGLFEVMGSTATFPDHLLPDTGIGLEWESMLSAVFVKSSFYGTRSTAVLRFLDSGKIHFTERAFDNFDNAPEAYNEIKFAVDSN